MFRLRKQSVNENEQTLELKSSLSSGNASIIKAIQPEYNTEDIMKEAIDLQATPKNMHHRELPSELTIESMSAVIAAAVQMSTSGGSPSSLELGSASIIPSSPTSPTTTKAKRRFSTRLFSWRKSTITNNNTNDNHLPPTLDSTITTTSEEESEDNSFDSPRSSSGCGGYPKTPDDDGRDELIYRGIQIKEIKTTLKPLIISDEIANPMPKVTLERPGFARINY